MTTRAVNVAAVIVAAGRGQRAGGPRPKQWQDLLGQPVLAHTLAAFERHPGVNELIVVISPEDETLAAPFADRATLVMGGETRSASVLQGLKATNASHVLIHDAARPCVSGSVIDAVLAALDEGAEGAAPGLSVTDALWTGEEGQVTGVQPRGGLYRAQTPQAFPLATILAAHEAYDGAPADDVEVARAAGAKVTIVPGEEANLKITLPEDFDRAAAVLRPKEAPMDIRLGNGYDVHRFGPGDHVILCGVKIPYERSLQGHSDADVGMHAVTDAIYGALAEGDIGRHFPPSDMQWKGAASDIFLRHACDLARKKGYRIGNVDCTLVCEFPKIGPHAAAMMQVMADIMGLAPTQISVKATTSERLGFTGRGEGIASLATVTLIADGR